MFVVAVVVVLALGEASALAQDKPPPTPIPLPEIASRFETVTASLRTVETLLAPRSDVMVIEQALPAMSTRVAERREATERVLAGAPSLAALDALADSWQPVRLELGGALTMLRTRARALEDAREKLTTIHETWTRTREEALRTRAPGPVLRRVDGVLTSVAAARTQLETARAAVLVLQDKVAEDVSRADAALGSIGASRVREAGRLFVRESPPVWSPELRAHPWREVPERVRESLRAFRNDLRQFGHEAAGRLLLQGVLLVGITAFLVIARKRVRQWGAADEATEPTLAMLAHPVAAALVLALLASPWIHRQQPRAAWTLAQIGTFVPMLLVLRALMPRPLLPGLYVLGGFFVLDSLRTLAVVIPLLEYALFMLEMLAATALVAWLLVSRPGRRLVELCGPSRLIRTLTLAGRLALAGFGVALVAGAVGSMSLARLVGAGVLGSTYIALLFYAGFRLLATLTTLGLRLPPLSELRMVQNHRALLQARVIACIRTVGVVGWLGMTLEYFNVLRPVVTMGRAVLGAGWSHGAVYISVGEVLAFILTVWGSFLISSFVRFVLAEDVFPRMRLADGVSHAATTLLHYALLFVGFLLSVAALGVDMNRLALLGGAFGVGLGFGLQNVVNNFISGLIVLFERPIRVGDVVEVGGVAGVVGRIGIRASTIRTWDGSDLIVPNSAFVSERVTNRTPAGRRVAVTVPVRVAYGTAPDKVIAVLCETAQGQPGVLPIPAPVGLFTGFGETGLAFELRAWTTAERSIDVRSELGVAVYAALRSAGMHIPALPPIVRIDDKPQ